MAISEAKKKANAKWNKENMKDRYDRIQIVVQKGKRAKIQAMAAENGETVSGMINRLLDQELSARGYGISEDNSKI